MSALNNIINSPVDALSNLSIVPMDVEIIETIQAETSKGSMGSVPLEENVRPVATMAIPMQGVASSIHASMEMKTRMAMQHMQNLYEAAHKQYVDAMLVDTPVATLKSLSEVSEEMVALLKKAKEAQMNWEEDKKFTSKLQQHANPASPSRQQVVPHNLPKFQLTEQEIWSKGNAVFNSTHDFLHTFEIQLEAYSLDSDAHWRRLLPLCLNMKQDSWFANKLFKQQLSWEQAKKQIMEKYDSPLRKFQLMVYVSSLYQGQHEQIGEYTDKFQKLCCEAGIEDNTQLAVTYYLSILPEIQDMVLYLTIKD
ncbi:hypothetical protein DFQ28_001985, partial [Apophysomyces sp. BC1034]